jgi:hypothetical protein
MNKYVLGIALGFGAVAANEVLKAFGFDPIGMVVNAIRPRS